MLKKKQEFFLLFLSLNSVFLEFPARANKIFIWPEDWALVYHSTKFRHFPDIF